MYQLCKFLFQNINIYYLLLSLYYKQINIFLIIRLLKILFWILTPKTKKLWNLLLPLPYSIDYISVFPKKKTGFSDYEEEKKQIITLEIELTTITPETLKDKRTFSNASQFCSNSITNKEFPLRSVYYRLFDAMEGRNVPPNTHSLYQQISMLSPQTPRNKRRCVLGKCIIQAFLVFL